MAIFKAEKWCPACASEKLHMRTTKFWLCLTCYAQNDGTHPAESCLAVREVQEENKKKLFKEANKKRVFPKLQHTNHRRITCMTSRSIRAQVFKHGR